MPRRLRPLVALVVDDDDEFRESLVAVLRAEGHEVRSCGTLEAARNALAPTAPDLLFIDLTLPDGRGMDLMLEPAVSPGTAFVVVSGDASVAARTAAYRRGASDFLVKPIDMSQLMAVLHAQSAGRTLRAEVSGLRGALRDAGLCGRMAGRSPAMREVFDRITRVAPTSAPVLLTGESGTGKELAARTIHEMSPRREATFVAINCGAVPAALIESSLFGHEKGSFTGAEQRYAGVFEQADGSTLFLDEIGEMPRDLQVRLLRVLEEQSIRRVGGTEDVRIDVRLIAATNRDPVAAVAEGTLREDLYHRINVFPVRLPPLRERAGDVRLLAAHILESLNAEGGAPRRLSESALVALECHEWRGNVRELRNVLQRASILAGEEIEVAHLELAVSPAADRSPGADPPPGGAAADPAVGANRVCLDVGLALADAERRVILATLAHCGGNKRKTARVLRISVKTLYSRLEAYGRADGP
jgi:two-component system response regulator AtoC